MKAKPIRTKKDYETALYRLEQLMGAKRGTPEGDELEVLSALVDTYEEKHFPIGDPEPVKGGRAR